MYTKLEYATNKVRTFKLDDDFKVQGIYDIGDARTAVVVENAHTHFLRFLQINSIDEDDNENLSFVQLGIMNTNDMETSPENKAGLVKVDLVRTRDLNGDPINVALALRTNGKLDFYNDFMLVDELHVEEDSKVVEIRNDFQHFVIKREHTSLALDDSSDCADNYSYFKCPISWKNRIGPSVLKPMDQEEKWDIVLHRRIAPYFNMYPAYLNFETYFLVAHDRFVSIFNLSRGTWEHTYPFSDDVLHLNVNKRKRKNQDSKQYADLHQVVVVVGTNELFSIRINKNEHLKVGKKRFTLENRRILDYKDEHHKQTGLYLLTDKVKPKRLFKENGSNKFF